MLCMALLGVLITLPQQLFNGFTWRYNTAVWNVPQARPGRARWLCEAHAYSSFNSEQHPEHVIA